MVPMNILGPDVLIVVAVVLVLFGGAKLAGVGKGAGRAIREFREETANLSESAKPGVKPEPQEREPRSDG